METLMTTLKQEQFENLHKDLDKVRSNSKTVKVNKEALTKLLIDHSTFIESLEKDFKVTIKQPQ